MCHFDRNTDKLVSDTVVHAARNTNASILIILVTKISAVFTLGVGRPSISTDGHSRVIQGL